MRYLMEQLEHVLSIGSRIKDEYDHAASHYTTPTLPQILAGPLFDAARSRSDINARIIDGIGGFLSTQYPHFRERYGVLIRKEHEAQFIALREGIQERLEDTCQEETASQPE